MTTTHGAELPIWDWLSADMVEYDADDLKCQKLQWYLQGDGADMTLPAEVEFDNWPAVRDAIADELDSALDVTPTIERAWAIYNMPLGEIAINGRFTKWDGSPMSNWSDYRSIRANRPLQMPYDHERDDVNWAYEARFLFVWGLTDDTPWGENSDEQNQLLRRSRARLWQDYLAQNELSYINPTELRAPGSSLDGVPNHWEYVALETDTLPNDLYLTENDSADAKARNRCVIVTEVYMFRPVAIDGPDPLEEVPVDLLDRYVDYLNQYIAYVLVRDEYDDELAQIALRRREIVRYYLDEDADLDYYSILDVKKLWGLYTTIDNQFTEDPSDSGRFRSFIGDKVSGQEETLVEKYGVSYDIGVILRDLIERSDEFDEPDDFKGITFGELMDAASEAFITDGRSQLERYLKAPWVGNDEYGEEIDIAVGRFHNEVFRGGQVAIRELDVGWTSHTAHPVLNQLQSEIEEKMDAGEEDRQQLMEALTEEAESGGSPEARTDALVDILETESPILNDGDSVYHIFAFEPEEDGVPGPYDDDAGTPDIESIATHND